MARCDDSRPVRSEASALEEAKREFDSVLEMLSGTFYRCELTAPWRATFVSGGIAALTGYPPEFFTERAIAEILHPDDVERVDVAISAAIEAHTQFTVEYRILSRSGETVWVRDHGRGVYDEEGKALFAEGIVTSISDEKRYQAEIARTAEIAAAARAQLINALESTSDCIVALDRSWRFSYLNARASAEIAGGGDLVGRHVLEAFPSLPETPFWDAYQEVMRERRPARLEGYFPALGSWYEIHAVPSDEGLTIFFSNIDHRRAAEETLRQRERQLQRTLDHIPQMVWSTLPDGHHDYFSKPWYDFTGVPVGTTDGERWNGMFHPEDRERAWSCWRHALATGDPYEIEYRLRHRSGEYRWVLGRAWAERGEDGRIVRWYGTCTDIHDRVLAQRALEESRRLQQSILEASADCIIFLDPGGALELVNGPGAIAMELDDPAVMAGRDWAGMWPRETRATAAGAVEEARSGQVSRFTGFCPTAKGTPKWWDVVVTPMRDAQGAVTRLLVVSRDITASRDAAERLRWTSEHDALTGLPNRRAFQAHLQAATVRAMERGSLVGLLLIDLDHFKHVNDTLGHAAGDHLLQSLGERLRACTRAGDFCARLGGDEFAVILENVREEEDLVRAGASILGRLQQPLDFDGRMIFGAASIGGALFPRDASSALELFKNADTALYALKGSGRGGTRMFHNHMREEAQRVASQLNLARMVVTERTIVPHYQPKVDLRTRAVRGLEALLRWEHPSRGLQLPDTVAEAFREYELSSKIGALMQERVFADIARWTAAGLDMGPVSLNAAPAEFLRDDYAENLLARLDRHKVAPGCIEVEVTEHVFLDRSAQYVARALQRMKAAGIRIALDDFGTGHSSLSHLRDFPVDVVKIDRSFVSQIAADPEIAAIVRAVIDLSNSLRLEVVAEGVENDEQRAALEAMGCTLAQGFLFGRPVVAEEIARLARAAA